MAISPSGMDYFEIQPEDVVVTDLDDQKFSGQLISVDEETFMIGAQGKGRKAQSQDMTFRYDGVKTVVYNITF